MILAGLAVLCVLAFLIIGVTRLFPHKPRFEELTSYHTTEEMIAADEAFREEVEQKILELGENGSDFRKANAGDAEAQYHVGNLYLYGTKTQAKDYPQAYRWLSKAVKQRYAPAEYQIGRLYANGWGVPASYPEALTWYRRAAEDGDGWAQRHLGEIYLSSFGLQEYGIQQDYEEADFWLTIGTANDLPGQQYNVDRDFLRRFVADQKAAEDHLTDDQVAKVKQRARQWQVAHPLPTSH